MSLLLIAVSTFYTYQREKKAFMDGLERKLVAAAYAVNGMLPADYHGRIEDADSISAEEYAKYVGIFNEYAWSLNLEYVYSYMMFDGKIRTTSSSFTKDEMAAGDDTPFFYHYEEPADELPPLFAGAPIGVPVYSLYNDPEYGHLLSAFIPLRTPSGKIYVIGADVEFSYIKEKQLETLRTCLIAAVAFILLSIGAAIYSISTISKPIVSLVNTAREISQGQDYTLRAEKLTNDELGEVVDGFNEMLDEIRERDEKLARHRDKLEAEVARRTAELVELNHDLEGATKEALKANEAKSTFLASMSHELRTPLNAVIGYSEMLSEEAEDSGLVDFIPDLNKIHSAGKHLLSLINNVLDLSKIEAGKMTLYNEWFEVDAMLEEVVGTIQPLVEKEGNRLQVDCAPDIGRMFADVTKIRQSLFNLLSNAAKFTKAGDVGLKLWRESDSASGDTVFMQVTDSGIGMSEEQIGRLFSAFTQADGSTTRDFGGTGLGLTITKQFCEMMGGEVTVKSVEGEGSVFTIRLPAVQAAPDKEPAGANSAAKGIEAVVASAVANGGAKGTILVIDDEENSRNLMQRALAKAGFNVHTAPNGPKGLELAQQLLPAVITLDVMMPGMDGWAVLNQLKADPALRHIPVIMVTMVDERQLGYSLGASEFISKPIDTKLVANTFRKYQTADGPNRYALVVEDDADARQLLCRQLAKELWECREAENGRVALDIIAEHGPPAVILLDLMMPVMSGIQFVERLRENPAHKGIPTIVVTGKEISAEEREILNGDVIEILRKGEHSSSELLAEIQSLIDAAVGSPRR